MIISNLIFKTELEMNEHTKETPGNKVNDIKQLVKLIKQVKVQVYLKLVRKLSNVIN